MLFTLASLFALASFASAAQPLWAQCGGINFTGDTTCVSGATCTFMNDFYSQCIPSSQAPTTSASTTTAAPPSGPTAPAGTNFWFSFGDSYTQTGFNISGPLPSVSNPFGNPPYPGFTATGGANWVGFASTTFNHSRVFTYNYAYGGATIDATLVPPFEPTVLSLTDQVNQFLTTVASKPASTPWTSANALFSIWIGVNDIGNSYWQSGDRNAFADVLLNAEFALVQKLYNAGARNFLFLNVPTVDRTPLMLAQPASSQSLEKTVIASFNTKYAAKINAFKAANSGVKTFLYDTNAAFTTILNAPQSFGFRDATSFGSASDMFWGNDYHPSTFAHKIFGQQIGNTLLAGTVW